MKRNNTIHNRPEVDVTLFWDWDYEKMDFRKAYISVISRILERGTAKEYEEMIRFYGRDKVIQSIKNEIQFLPDYAIEKVAKYFSLFKEEMKCYTEKQSRPNYWI